MAGFKLFGTTADVGVDAEGSTLPELFSNISRGLYSIYADVERIEPIVVLHFAIEAGNLLDGLISYLNELIYLTDSRNMLFSKFDISVDSSNRISASVYGDIIRDGGILKTPVKAATYHQAKLYFDGVWHASIIFDI